MLGLGGGQGIPMVHQAPFEIRVYLLIIFKYIYMELARVLFYYTSLDDSSMMVAIVNWTRMRGRQILA